MKKIVMFIFSFLIAIPVLATPCTAKVEVCFTPGEPCTQRVIDALNQARQQLLIQAYSFTSAPIAKAVVDAYRRGVNVEITLDKSQLTQHYSSATFFENQHIPLWVDNQVAIAHNKIIIVDKRTSIGGYIGNNWAAIGTKLEKTSGCLCTGGILS